MLKRIDLKPTTSKSVIIEPLGKAFQKEASAETSGVLKYSAVQLISFGNSSCLLILRDIF